LQSLWLDLEANDGQAHKNGHEDELGCKANGRKWQGGKSEGGKNVGQWMGEGTGLDLTHFSFQALAAVCVSIVYSGHRRRTRSLQCLCQRTDHRKIPASSESPSTMMR